MILNPVAHRLAGRLLLWWAPDIVTFTPNFVPFENDAIKKLDQLRCFDAKSSFLLYFAHDCLLQRLPYFYQAARNRPFAQRGRSAATSQEYARDFTFAVNNNGADAY